MTEPLPIPDTAADPVRHTRPVPAPQLAAIATAALLCAVPLADTTPATAADEAPAGYIEHFAGPSEDYLLTRAGQALPVYPLMQVYPGDEVTARWQDGHLRLHLGESETLDLNLAQSPYAVPAGGQVPTIGGNLMRWAAGLFGAMPQAQPGRVPGYGRGEEPVPPGSLPLSGLLVPGTRLTAGRRPLALAWRGGRAPYRVRIGAVDPDALPLAELTGLAEPRCRTPELALTPGAWRIDIADAAGRTLSTEVTVVPAGEAPSLDPTALPRGLAAATACALDAAWLAGQGDGWLWRLQAYQQVADLGDDAAAEWLRWALVADRELPAPPVTATAPERASEDA